MKIQTVAEYKKGDKVFIGLYFLLLIVGTTMTFMFTGRGYTAGFLVASLIVGLVSLFWRRVRLQNIEDYETALTTTDGYMNRQWRVIEKIMLVSFGDEFVVMVFEAVQSGAKERLYLSSNGSNADAYLKLVVGDVVTFNRPAAIEVTSHWFQFLEPKLAPSEKS